MRRFGSPPPAPPALRSGSARRAAPTETAAVEAAARAFLASLSTSDRGRASFAFGSAERTRWHWTVPASVPRNGLPLGAVSPESRRLALRLLRASASASGYRKALDIMALQGVLQRMSTGLTDAFDPDLYYVSVFGTPAPAGGAGGSRATTCPATSRSWATRSSSSRSSSGRGRPAREARSGRSGAANGPCPARRTPRERSCSCSTARCGGKRSSRPSRSPTTSPRIRLRCGRSTGSAYRPPTCRRPDSGGCWS